MRDAIATLRHRRRRLFLRRPRPIFPVTVAGSALLVAGTVMMAGWLPPAPHFGVVAPPDDAPILSRTPPDGGAETRAGRLRLLAVIHLHGTDFGLGIGSQSEGSRN